MLYFFTLLILLLAGKYKVFKNNKKDFPTTNNTESLLISNRHSAHIEMETMSTPNYPTPQHKRNVIKEIPRPKQQVKLQLEDSSKVNEIYELAGYELRNAIDAARQKKIPIRITERNYYIVPKIFAEYIGQELFGIMIGAMELYINSNSYSYQFRNRFSFQYEGYYIEAGGDCFPKGTEFRFQVMKEISYEGKEILKLNFIGLSTINVDTLKSPKVHSNHVKINDSKDSCLKEDIFKEDEHKFLQIIKRHKILRLYHFTERSNLSSIKQHNGIFSIKYLRDREINYKSSGSKISWEMASKKGLENYVHLSFVHDYPMMHVAIKEKRISDPILLEIDPTALLWKNTSFCHKNSAKKDVRIGNSYSDFMKIKFEIFGQNYFELSKGDQLLYQAEVLVLEKVPTNAILNLHNPVSIL